MADTTASADSVAAFRNGEAMPAADAPSASAFAASMPVRRPPLAINGVLGAPATRHLQRLHGRDAPVGEGQTKLASRFGLCPIAFDGAPGGAARAGNVDGRHPSVNQAASKLLADTPANLLNHHRCAKFAANALDLTQHPAPVPIAIRLQCLLQWIHVQDQRIGANHIDRPPAVIHAVAPVELHCAEVGKQQDVRGHVAHPEGVGRFGCSRPARCEPSPMATPRICAPSAKLRLMATAAVVPPVIDEIKSGSLKDFPNNSTPVLTARRSSSGSA